MAGRRYRGRFRYDVNQVLRGDRLGAMRCRGRPICTSLHRHPTLLRTRLFGHPAASAPRIGQVGVLDPYYFLSYARRHGPRVLVKRFYDDLCAELRRLRHGNEQLRGTPFLDIQSIQVGQDWNAALSQAIGHCRAMVALYTPDYFRSDFCGREWKAFEDRQRRHREATGADAKALIPVLWEPVQNIPDSVAHIQYENIAFGETYARVGLRRMLVSDPGGEYREIVRLLARQVATAAEHFRIPTTPGLDLSSLEAVGPFPSPADRAEPGSRVVLLVAARTAGGVDDDPTDPRCHGASPLDWNPYYEDTSDALIERAGRLLGERGFAIRAEVVSESLDDRLTEARRRRQVAILLVEAWATTDKPYATALAAYDRANHPGSAAIVPCGRGEAEGTRGEEYTRRVKSAFVLNWAKSAGEPLPLLQTAVSHRDFNATLHAIILKGQNQLFSLSEPSAANAASLPILAVSPAPPSPTEFPTPASPVYSFEEQE